MARPSRRRELLDAAIAVIRRDGAQALTLDAVAAAAGVSQVVVLYHFGTKRALIDGLLDSWLDDREAQLEGPDFAAAYVRACDMQSAGPEVTASEFGLLAARGRVAGAPRGRRSLVFRPARDRRAAGRGSPASDRAPAGARSGRGSID